MHIIGGNTLISNHLYLLFKTAVVHIISGNALYTELFNLLIKTAVLQIIDENYIKPFIPIVQDCCCTYN